MIEELYTTKQVAKVLGFAPKTLSNQRILGTGLPFIKIGNAVRYKKSDIETFIEENTHVTMNDFVVFSLFNEI